MVAVGVHCALFSCLDFGCANTPRLYTTHGIRSYAPCSICVRDFSTLGVSHGIVFVFSVYILTEWVLCKIVTSGLEKFLVHPTCMSLHCIGPVGIVGCWDMKISYNVEECYYPNGQTYDSCMQQHWQMEY